MALPKVGAADFSALPPELVHRALAASCASDVAAASRACRAAAALHAYGIKTTKELLVVDALVSALQRPNAASRAHAARLLEDVTAAVPPSRLASLPDQVFGEAVQQLRDRVSNSKAATTAALHAVEAGAVAVLGDMLLDGPERRGCELALGALERLCRCAEGRAELVAHGAGVAAVGSRALRVSEVATDKAVRMLRSVARHAATAAVV
ncbi:E3 ubiquitin-protein ligase PUB23-like [Panicum virgatum]|uniref:E3 ubiquitin-protein ligase PUB23-like n=1 Tax=Panicum virgatum TaxID=38727 RepID=UPI0019D6970E|nr:E3 ubiquitin-protein ligase PUB23-like [Panicum virgatum]